MTSIILTILIFVGLLIGLIVSMASFYINIYSKATEAANASINKVDESAGKE